LIGGGKSTDEEYGKNDDADVKQLTKIAAAI
jgi:hypothetical protein